MIDQQHFLTQRDKFIRLNNNKLVRNLECSKSNSTKWNLWNFSKVSHCPLELELHQSTQNLTFLTLRPLTWVDSEVVKFWIWFKFQVFHALKPGFWYQFWRRNTQKSSNSARPAVYHLVCAYYSPHFTLCLPKRWVLCCFSRNKWQKLHENG